MNRNRSLLLLSLLALTMVATVGCSMNRQLPESMDAEAMEAEVRAAIMAVAPGKTMDVDITEGGRVTLKGHADSQSQKNEIVTRVQKVSGVRSVNASEVHVQ
jgi:osmotically-inducible protein OsmY